MDIVRHNLHYFDNLTKESEPLNITILKNNKIVQNEKSWLRSSSVDLEELFRVIQWTFDTATINFWENYFNKNWLSVRYQQKYTLMYEGFVSLQYIYDKCEPIVSDSLMKQYKDYDKELDERMDIMHEACNDTCGITLYIKNFLRQYLNMNTGRYECIESDEMNEELSSEESEDSELDNIEDYEEEDTEETNKKND